MKLLNKMFICTSTIFFATTSTTLQLFATDPSITLDPDPSDEANTATLEFTTEVDTFHFIQGTETLKSEEWDYLPHATYGDGSLYQADIPTEKPRYFYRVESATDPKIRTYRLQIFLF